MTVAAPSPLGGEAFRDEAVAVLANMTMASPGGGGEQRGEDHQLAPRPARGDLPAPVVDRRTEHHRHARSYRPGLVGGLPRLGSSRTVPVPSHCRQSSTLIPMQSSAGQSAVAVRVTTWSPPGRRRAARRRRIRRTPSRLRCCDGGCRGHVDCSDPLFGRRLRAGAAPQGRGEVEPVRGAAGAYHGPLGRVDQEGPATG
jgi:hypothetical protein